MNSKTAKKLRKQAKASGLLPETGYEYKLGARFVGFGATQVQSPIVVSSSCVRGFYRNLKRNFNHV